MRAIRAALGIALISLTRFGHAYEMEDVKRMEFQVRDPNSREVYFEGYEQVQEEAGRSRKQTYYFDREKKEVYFEDARFNLQSLRVEEYTAVNRLNGEETVFKTEGEKVRVSFRPTEKEKPREEVLPWGDNGYHTKVVTQLILRNWADIVGGKPYKFDLLLPFRFESLGFQLVSNKRVKVDGEERESFLLQPQNFIIRAFVPRMEFQFSIGPKPRVRLYRGPSPLPVAGETNKTMDMLFTYPTVG